MSLQLNNQNDGYYDNVFLLDSTTFLFNEVRDLIAAGGGSGGGTVTGATLPLLINNGNIETLFTPSCITVSSGIVTTANDTLGSLDLSLNFTVLR